WDRAVLLPRLHARSRLQATPPEEMGVYLLDSDISAAGGRALRRVRRVQQDLSRDRAPAGCRQRPAATPCATYARRRPVAHAVRGHVADGGREEQRQLAPVRI